LTAADTAEATARAAADTTLQANIDAEASARATAITNLVNGADAALDTLKEIGDALAAGDTSVTNALTTQITTEATTRAAALVQEATDRTAAIEAAKTLLNTSIAAVQSDVDSNEADADAAIALRATIANPNFTGSLSRLLGANTDPTVTRTEGGFPDFVLRSNGANIALNGNEGRLLWEDGGGGATAAIKSTMLTSEPMKFFTGGITASDEAMRINANGRVGIGTTNPQALLHVEGSAVLKADFPDLQFYSGGERRILFSDAGGGAQGGIKFSSNTMKFFAGGIAGGNQILSLDADSVDVSQTLVCTDGINTNDLNIDGGQVTFNTGSKILASTAGFATAGTVTTGSISTTGAGSIDAADLALPNIPEYADDAAAATGGLAVGHVYRTGSVVKIRVS